MLSIKNIHKRFGTVHALNNVSLELSPGLFGLLGPNGAGKSTLMRTLATLQTPDSGTVTYNGVDIVSDPNIVRRVLGYLPQDFGVYPRMSAIELLDHIAVLKGVSNKKERQEQVLALLSSVDLFNQQHKKVSTFSGGMRQRFGVAQAMIGNPKILIVDEPTAGLDPEQRQRFLNLLSEAGEDKIIILSTHIVDDVLDLCPDMAIMGDGRIVARDAPGSLIDKIRDNVWRKTVEKSDVDDMKSKFSILSTRLLATGVIVSVYSAKKPENGFKKDEPNLEDAYFAHLNGFV